MNWFRKLAGRGSRAFKRRYISRGLMLTYHRVAEDSVDPWGLCVSPANFARHMELIRAMGFRPVHVSELADALRERRLARRTIAVTFDDGYVDNLDAARPILERYETPATHYATAGYIGSDEPFWWDVLDFIFLRPGQLPYGLEITLSGNLHRWTLDDDDRLLRPGDERQWPDWRALSSAPTRRHEIHDAIWRLLVTALPAERERIVRELLDWAALERSTWAQVRPMSEGELRALRGDGLVEIGAHGLTHPALSAMPPAVQAHELNASKSRLEKILKTTIRGCAYPHGRTSLSVQQLARDAGYDFACGSEKRAVEPGSNLFELPRVSVKNWGEARFRSLLEHHIAA